MKLKLIVSTCFQILLNSHVLIKKTSSVYASKSVANFSNHPRGSPPVNKTTQLITVEDRVINQSWAANKPCVIP